MTDYDKLKEIVDEIDVLLQKQVTACSSEFQAWKNKASRFLIKKYGEQSFEIRDFKKYRFSLVMYCIGSTPRSAFVNACANDLESIKGVFNEYLREMKEENNMNQIISETQKAKSNVFIVHGHDGELKHSVARLLEGQGITPIILDECENQGNTIIEKFENYSCDVSAAICLFTADDFGNVMDQKEKKHRARQNVVFETGYFIGKLGRKHIVIISEKDIELPSDLQGVLFTDKDNWKLALLKELKSIGYSFDLNKLV